ncbi:MAG TPA: diaminopimelate decarboxylase [Dictyoglomaceae bacterium]|nr:diaminopimelate decarboxylase [Dictyoglomaceae bacterium]HOL38964.1 diaminopimelate decarboxylase [Dictyoglomaceae bacterium]HPP15619.1 diaminopimelate decarboxylase [Dictyoglomaceae bacterium]HPU43514.1 diaminopimelate decarboxylase [Dictyoglomaceae bacterium]
MENNFSPETFLKENEEWNIGGVNLSYLGDKYGTPLYILDKQTLISQARAYINSWRKYYKGNYKVLYALKALPVLEVIRIFKEEGLGTLVSTGGELFLARNAGVNPQNIYFHGNAKSIQELEYAIKEAVGTIILDNFDEFEKLKYITQKKDRKINVLVRIIPNIEVKTHNSIRTGQMDTKFGLPISQALKLIDMIRSTKNITFKGIHAHIGSQIFDINAYVKLAEVLSEVYKIVEESKLEVSEMSIGGGLGIAYTEDDNPPKIEDLASSVSNYFKESIGHSFTLICEPGRSLVGRAGITLYKIESRKEIPDVRKYVAVDGGMSDNIRPSLYGAKYTAILLNNSGKEVNTYSLAGKHCESGDILIKDLNLPWPEIGEYIVVFTTGAYNFSMFTWYNATLRPAVVMIENGKDKLIVRRETFEDLLRGQI